MNRSIKETVQDWINKGIQDAEDQLKQLNAKEAKMSWTCWLEWNGMVRIHWEFTKECLEEMKLEFERLSEDASPEEIILWVKGRKTYFVNMVITTHTPCSSNPMKNLIVMEKMDVWRKFGDDGTASIEYLLLKLWKIISISNDQRRQEILDETKRIEHDKFLKRFYLPG